MQSDSMRELFARAAAALVAVSWFVFPGFGVIDLLATWSADWPQALEAGWGLFATAIVGAAFLLVALRPRRWMSAAAQLTVAAVALAVSAAAAEESRLLWLAAVLALEAAIVVGLARHGVRRQNGSVSGQPRRSGFFVLAAVGAAPWLVYALQMWSLNREDRPVDVTISVDHYAVQGALGLALAFLPALAAVGVDRLAFAPACAGVAASYLGLISLAWPDAQGGLSDAWAVAAIVWGLALLGVAVFPRRSRPVAPSTQPV